MLNGKARKFGDNISTDLIAPGRYFHLRSDLPELAKHTLEDADKDFALKVKPGDFVVAGENFGLGSSREHAPIIIKLCKVSAVIAKSFSRIFFRNALNIGLPVLECNTDEIDDMDELDVDMSKGVIKNKTKAKEFRFQPLSSVALTLLEDGGLLQHIKKNNGLKLR
ncbi:MAG: 3-isopropylmalate dehydratase small subunit [bacterium]